jgi:hypothetical protein
MQSKSLQGKWEWNQSFTYARVIHYYGIWPPSKFWEASDEDRAWAIGHYEAEMGIQAWDNHVQNVKHESDAASLSRNRD